eukprot:gene6331-181_t
MCSVAGRRSTSTPRFVAGWLQLNGGLHASAAGSPPVIGHWRNKSLPHKL